MNTFIENYHVAPLGVDIDFNTAASNLSDSVDMTNFHRATFLIQLADIGTASPVLYAYSGATAGASTSALTFRYAFGGAAQGTAVAGSTASCDVLTAWSTSAALTLTHGTYDNFLLFVDIKASEMDMANNENWLTLDFTDPGGATGQAIVLVVLEPRYASNRHPTCLA
jgi:hypothetical protein